MNKQGEDSDNKHNDKNNNFIEKEKKMILVDEREPVGELPPPFPPRNIKVKDEDDMRDFYDIKKEIGRGRFGTVYLVEDKKTRQKFAAKFVNTRRNQDRANVEREVEIMKTLNADSAHPRLIQLYDAYDMEKEMCLVLEIVDGGELFERVINDDFVLTERACTVFVKQICEGVEFIHSKNILHLDMKPENILCLSREGNRVKICDFGLARKYDPRKKLQVLFGTPEFVAPEVVNFEPIGFGTDMWSIGVICYVLLSGLSPFMGHNYVETMTNVTHNKYDFDDEAFDCVSDEAKEFIQKLLVLDKSMRPTPAQCLRSSWLRSPPPPQYHPLSRRFPSSASNSEDEEEEDEEEESESESSEDDDDEEEEEVIKVEQIITNRVDKEEETEKYSVRRRRRKQEEEEEKARKRTEADEEERKRKEMEAKRKELERQIEEKKKKIAEEEERCKRMKEEEEEAKRKKEEEEVRRKKEEEEARRKEEEERRRQQEEAKRKEEEERRKKEREEEERKKKKEEEARRKREEEARKKKKEEEARRRQREEEEEVRRKELEAEKKRKEEEEIKRRAEEEKRRKEEEDKKTKEAEEKRRREAEEKRRKEAEEKKMKEAERKKREAEEKKKTEERRKKEEEEKKRKEAEKRREAEEKKKEMEEKKRKEAEEKKRKEVEEKRKAKERKRGGGGRAEHEGELERSKAQLRDFVARWNSHPNSPYVVVAEDVPRGLEGAKGSSGASLTSVAAQPPSDLNHEDLDDEEEAAAAGEDEEFIHYTISAPLKGPASPPQVARCLEARLNLLQRQDGTEDGKSGEKTSGRRKGRSGGRGSGRGEKRRSSSRSPSSGVLHDTEEAETIIKQILSSDHRSAYEEYQRMVGAMDGSGHLQRPEVVALQQEEGGTRRRSRTDSTSRRSRRQPSRDVPAEDRPPSREGNRSPAPPAHRRPSRDVPLSPSQMERIARAAPQAWPDLIVAPQDEADEEVRQFSLDVPVASLHKSPSGTLRSVPGLKVSAEPEADATPTPRRAPAPKGAPSLTPPPSPPSENYSKPALSPSPSPTPADKVSLAPATSPTPSSATDRKASLTPPPSPVPSHKDSVSSEDPPSRLVEWILDIGTRTPPREQSTCSLQDRVTQWEARDGGTPRPSPSPSPSRRLSPSPRPSPSTSPSRRSSTSAPVPAEVNKEGPVPPRRPQPPFNVLSQEDSSAEKVIHTPWGALKRSPSKTSFSKSPSREREALPTTRGRAPSPVRATLEASQGQATRTPSPREAAPASRQEAMNGWAPGGKSYTLPRSAKLLRQKSLISVPGQGDAVLQDADGSLKRKGKFPPSPNKRPLTPLLFTAQDRISMFEKQQPADTRGPPRPLARTRSSVTLGGSASSDPRADRSQVGFMKTKLLSKVRPGAAPTLPEEPASPNPARPNAA